MAKTMEETIMEFYYPFPGERQKLWRARIKAFLYGFCIAAMIFTGLGYFWHFEAVTEDHEKQVAKLKSTVEFFRKNCNLEKQAQKDLEKLEHPELFEEKK